VKHLWHSMEDLGAHAARGMKQLDMKLDLHLKSPRAYRPAYLRDEAAYVSGPPHLLSRIFRDLGLLAPHALPAADADAPPAAPPGSEAFQEHWFGPAAARWAMRGRGGGREPTADAITDMELEMQTRYPPRPASPPLPSAPPPPPGVRTRAGRAGTSRSSTTSCASKRGATPTTAAPHPPRTARAPRPAARRSRRRARRVGGAGSRLRTRTARRRWWLGIGARQRGR